MIDLFRPFGWQHASWMQLGQQLLQGTLPHALLFSGARGIGKRHFAEAFGRWALCLQPLPDGACGHCKGCELNRASTHPDFIVIRPEEEGKIIKVAQVRELIDSLGRTGQQGGNKVVIIEPIEAMNANASNALLKSLEEPTPGTYLLLVSHNPSSVLPTIRSRCQIKALAIPSLDVATDYLASATAASPDMIQEALREARGLPLTALSLLDNDALATRKQRLERFLALSLFDVDPIDVAASWQSQDIGMIVEWYQDILHRILLIRSGGASTEDRLGEHRWEAVITTIDEPLLHRYLEKILVTKRQLLSGANPNKQLLLEELLMDWVALLKASRSRVKMPRL